MTETTNQRRDAVWWKGWLDKLCSWNATCKAHNTKPLELVAQLARDRGAFLLEEAGNRVSLLTLMCERKLWYLLEEVVLPRIEPSYWTWTPPEREPCWTWCSLQTAMFAGNSAIAVALVESGALSTTRERCSLAAWAIRGGAPQLPVFRLVLARSPELARRPHMLSLAFEAPETANLDAVRALIELKAQVAPANFESALGQDNFKAAYQLLTDHGARPRSELLQRALRKPDAAALECVLGDPDNDVRDMERLAVDEFDDWCLVALAKNAPGYMQDAAIDCARVLLSCARLENDTPCAVREALVEAVHQQAFDLAQFLFEHSGRGSVDSLKRTCDTMSLLEQALAYSRTRATRWLLERGATVHLDELKALVYKASEHTARAAFEAGLMTSVSWSWLDFGGRTRALLLDTFAALASHVLPYVSGGVIVSFLELVDPVGDSAVLAQMCAAKRDEASVALALVAGKPDAGAEFVSRLVAAGASVEAAIRHARNARDADAVARLRLARLGR